MKILKSIIVPLIGIYFVMLGSLSLAQSTNQSVNTFSDQAPYYLMIGFENTTFQNDPADFKGNISITNGQFTVGKEVLITTDESLNSDSGDLGELSSQLNFDFKARLMKGLILRVFPNKNESANITVNVTRTLNGLTQNMEKNVTVDQNADNLNTETKSTDNSFDVKVYSMANNSGLSLEQRNSNYSIKMVMLKKVIGALRWAEQQYILGKISLDNLILVKDNFWKIVSYKGITPEKQEQFDVDLNRFIFRVNRGELKPSWFIYGLNRFTIRLTY